ncbi:hypothetical protein [Eisenbergiella sp.]
MMVNILNKTKNTINKWILLFIVIFTGIVLRFIVMSYGYNYDFESYCIVGELVSNLQNVYSKTERYNYGPIFSLIQGGLYRISSISANPIFSFRVLIVTLLTGVDLGIMYIILKKWGRISASLFFLNPVTILITGYHNQFDNMAILLMLVAISFFNKEKNWNWKDIAFILIASVSLITKHIFFIFPVWIFFIKGLPMLKRLAYTILPPFLFLVSFLPYVLNNEKALQGVVNNVFGYRSYNNAPLMRYLYNMIHLPQRRYFIVYCFIMIILGIIIYNEDIERHFQLYLISMIIFSSAIADQYLVIPMYAVCTMNKKMGMIYTIITTYYLLNSKTQLDLNLPLHEFFIRNGYLLACLSLCLLMFSEAVRLFPLKTHKLKNIIRINSKWK